GSFDFGQFGSIGEFGDLTRPFTGTFAGGGQVPMFNPSAYGAPGTFDPNAYGEVPTFNEKFVAPTGLTYMNDPGYKERMRLGTDAIEKSAASRGTLLTGGVLKDLNKFGQD